MPSADAARGRVRLATQHVQVLGRLVRDAPVDEDLAPYRDELAAAGLLAWAVGGEAGTYR